MSQRGAIWEVPAPLSSYPELATTTAWRLLVISKRREKGLTQEDLANAVGATQPAISGIESGVTKSTRAVVPICEVLGIGMPYALFEDELERRWLEAGRLLRVRDEKSFRDLLEYAERTTAPRSGE